MFKILVFTLGSIFFLALSLADKYQERLMTDLFLKYDATRRPSNNGSRTDIQVSMILEHFDFRERDGSFHFVGMLLAKWVDPALVWEPNQYGRITDLPISQKIAWVPDIEFYNNAPDKFLRTHRNGALSLANTGEFTWLDSIEVSTFCSMDMTNWPHDVHTCKLSLGSWTHHALDLDITNPRPGESMQFESIRQKNMEYKITEYSAAHVSTTYSCCTEPYTTIDYTITFKRSSDYVVMFRVCGYCVILLTIMSLVVKPGRSEILLLNGMSLWIIVMNLLYFSKQIASCTRGTPLIVSFFKHSMLLVTLAQMICISGLIFNRTKFRGKMPPFWRHVLKNYFVRLLAPEEIVPTQQELSTSQSRFEDVRLQESSNLITVTSYSGEWNQMATLIQRSGLILVSIGFSLLQYHCYV